MVVRPSRARGLLAVVAFATFAGCSMQSGNLVDAVPGAVTLAEPDAAAPKTPTTMSTPSPTKEGTDCQKPVGPSRVDEVCHLWRCEAAKARVVARWKGDVARCVAGDLDVEAGARAERLINVYRAIAGVAPIVVEPAFTGSAQECALVAHANEKLSHNPPRDWRCWSKTAARTSAVSLIANRSAPLAIGPFIEDPGNELTMVHRRWLLSEELEVVGLGSTDRYSCLVVDGSALAEGKEPSKSVTAPVRRGWVAWPPPGPVPIEAFTTERLDEAGWTVQSAAADLYARNVTVTVTDAGAPRDVVTTRLTPLLGSRSAIRIVPRGWTTKPGHAYVVRVRGEAAIDFTVEPVDCPM